MQRKNDSLHQYISKRFSYGIVVLTLIIIIGSVYNLVQIQSEINKNFNEKLLNEAKGIEKDVTRWLVEDLNLLNNLTDILSNLSYEELNYTKAYNKFMKLNFQGRNVDALYAGLENGSFINGSDWVAPKTYDPRVRPWYTAAEQASKPVIGDLYVDSSTEKYIFTVSMPFKTHDLLNGVVGMDIYLETVASRLKSIISGTDFKVVIFDGNGIVVYYTGDPYLAGQSVESFKNSKVHEMYKIFKSEKPKKNSWQRADGSSFVLIDTIEHSNWGIVVFSDKISGMAEANAGIQQHFLINGILIVLSFFAIYSFYHMDMKLKKNQISMEQKIIELNDAHALIEDINKQLEFKSYTDGLTHVYNRRYFEDQLERYWTQAEIEKKPIGIAIIDVDYFKRYNDLYGHVSGDQILIKICRDMSKVLTPKYVLSRYGGEEFVIIAYDTSSEELVQVCYAMRQAVLEGEYPHEHSEHGQITISIGVNVFVPTERKSIGDFIHMADQALYEAKSKGRNQIILHLEA